MVAQVDGPPSASSLDAIERAFPVNFIGSVALTQTMLPLLQQGSIGAHCKCVERTRMAPAQQRSKMGLCRWQVSRLQRIEGRPEHAHRATCLTTAYHLHQSESADPGYSATDLNHHRGTQTIPEGSSEIIRLALLPDGGPTGTFSDTQGIVSW